MKISKMIKNLQDFMNEYGDIDCYYAVDDEGNDYKEIYYTPSLFYVNEDGDVYSPEDAEDNEDDFELVCVVN